MGFHKSYGAKLLLLSLAILFLACSKDELEEPIPIEQQLQVALEAQYEMQNVQGVSASVIWPNGTSWTGAAGFSYSNVPIEPNMLFGAGSISKHFMATLTLLLVEDGLLSLSDRLDKWIDDLAPEIDPAITIHQLLNHTSGISSYTANREFGQTLFADSTKNWTPREILTFVENPLFNPGMSWSYSNSNFLLLGMVAESATNTLLHTILQNRIFGPLNMTNTFLPEDELSEPERAAIPWSRFDISNLNSSTLRNLKGMPRQTVYSGAWSAGAIISTSSELARYMKAIYLEEFLSSESLNLMTEFVPISTAEFPHIGGYGLGSMQFLTLREYWGHSGDVFGYGAIAGYIPQDQISVAVLVNQDIDENTKAAFVEEFIKVLSAN